MRGQKVCKKCQVFIDDEKCPICQGTSFTDNWKGKAIILNPEKSEIAQRLKIKQKGRFAIKL